MRASGGKNRNINWNDLRNSMGFLKAMIYLINSVEPDSD